MKKIIITFGLLCGLLIASTVYADTTTTSTAGVSFVGESTYASQACTIENGVVAVKDAPSVRVQFSNAEGDWICSVDSQLDLKPYGKLDSLSIEVVPEG